MKAFLEGRKNYNKYPKYKESGIDWLGEIPEGWEVKKLKYICDKYADYGLNIEAEKYQDNGIRFIRTSDIDNIGNLSEEGVYLNKEVVEEKYLLDDGDLLISRSGTIGRSFLYDLSKHEKSTYAGYLVRYSLLKDIVFPKYVFYFMQSFVFFEWLKTKFIETTIGNVNAQKYANLPILLFNFQEQQAIANFLDRETSKIDQLIEKKQKLVELLLEKRTALISNAVTKGLDPNVKMKDSGVEWLGKIPEGWESLPVWMLFFLGRGRVINNEEILDNAGDYPVYSSQTEDNGILGFINTYDFEGEYITWTTDGANAGTVFYRKGKFNCTNVCGTLKEKGLRKLDLRYMTHALNCITKVFVRYDINPKLMNNVIAGIRIQVPTYEVQKSIADFLDSETSKICSLIQKIQTQIKKLKEYRTALISEAVTGKIKVN